MIVSRRTDRISSLPEDIIHEHIFCHLSDKDIKRMSCLSKTWYQLSYSFPILVFSKSKDDYDDEEEDEKDTVVRKNSKQNTHDKYLNYIDGTLHRFHNLNQIISRVGIYLDYRHSRARLVDTWIDLVLRHRFEEFNLCLTTQPPKRWSWIWIWYNLPPSVFSHPNSIIKVARFRGCSLLKSFPHPNSIPNMLMIKKLSLNLVVINETSLRSIISCCPLIEHLSIVDCICVIKYCLRISELHKLKHLTIVRTGENVKRYSTEFYGFVEIEAPSLQTLDIKGFLFSVNIIGYYPILTDLALRDMYEVEFPDITSFPLLCSLCLLHIYSWRNLNLVSDTLKFEMHKFNGINPVSMTIDVPNLQSFVYSEPNSPWHTVISYSIHQEQTLKPIRDSLVEFRDFISKNEIVQRFKPIGESLVEFSYFISKMKHVKHLDLHFQCDWERDRYFTFKEELKRRLVQSPGSNVGNFNLFFCDNVKNYHVAVLNVIDAIIWTCHPRIFSIKLYGWKFTKEDVVRYMCSFSTRSWYKYVHNVMYVTEDGTEYTTSIIDCVQLLKVLSTGFGDSTCIIQSKSGRHVEEVRLMMQYSNFNSQKSSKQTPSAPPHGAVHTPQASMYFTPAPAAAPYAPPPSAPRCPPVSAYPPPVSAYRSPASAYRPPASALPPPASAYPTPASAYRLPASTYPFPTSAYPPPASAYPTPASAYRLPASTNYPPPASSYPSPVSAYSSYPLSSAPYPPNPYRAPSAYPPQPYDAPSAYPPQPYPPQPQRSPYYPPGPYPGAYPPPPYC